MKRDWELIRQILLTVEQAQAGDRISDNDIGCNEETFHYNAILLSQAGLVQAMILPNLNTTLIEGLTWEGHEFLDAIRDEAMWQLIKQTAAEKRISLSFAAIKAIEQHLFKAKFN